METPYESMTDLKWPFATQLWEKARIKDLLIENAENEGEANLDSENLSGS